jgi:ABC-type xylose transport system permease subunit
MQNIINRVTSKTPRFFVRLRTIGLVLSGVATAILTAPVAIPAGIVTAAGYLAVGGTVATVVSQLTVAADDLPKADHPQKGGDDASTSD